MSDDYQPRKNDALVEPMFEALGGAAEEHGQEEECRGDGAGQRAPESPSSRGARWLLGVALLAVVAWIFYELQGSAA